MRSLVFLLLLVPLSEAIRCFQCDTLESPECGTDLNESSVFYLECNDFGDRPWYPGRGAQGCSKRVTYLENRDRVLRSCSLADVAVDKYGNDLQEATKEDRCVELDIDGGREEFCTCFSDGCNSGWALLGSALGLLLSCLLASFS